MPYVKIEVTREGVTKQQKQALISGVIINVDGGMGAGYHLN